MNIGIYLRLSKEDYNLEEDNNSESINNQKSYIEKYIQENNLVAKKIYIDDGYSGLNFERPGFQKMINDIENQIIDTIITKDLSRLGRDYIQVGYYLERYFPEKNIRYIAINDNYDNKNINNTNNDFAPFKAVFNDMYAKDISKKVKTAFKTLQGQGKYLGTSAPYGYDKDNIKKGKLIINKKTSEVIKKIFELYLADNSVCRITKILNDENIDSPQKVKNIKGKSTKWNETSVTRILKNEVYIGNMVQNKTNCLNYKSSKKIKVPKENWIRVENTHEPIISKEDFEIVQAKLLYRTRNFGYFGKEPKNLLAGFIYCGECGRKLTYDRKNMRCRGRSIYECESKYYRVKDIEKIVIDTVKDICKEYIDDKILENMNIQRKELLTKNIKITMNNIKQRLETIKKSKLTLYKDKLNGIITEEDYIIINNEISKEYYKNEMRLKEIEQELLENIKKNKNEELIENTIKEVINNVNIDRNILSLLIDKIYVYKNKNIQIKFKFKKPTAN